MQGARLRLQVILCLSLELIPKYWHYNRLNPFVYLQCKCRPKPAGQNLFFIGFLRTFCRYSTVNFTLADTNLLLHNRCPALAGACRAKSSTIARSLVLIASDELFATMLERDAASCSSCPMKNQIN